MKPEVHTLAVDALPPARRRRWPWAVLALAVAAGVALGSHPASGSGTLVLRLDPVTCQGAGSVEVFVDGASRGVHPMAPGGETRLVVATGTRLVGARERGGQGTLFPAVRARVGREPYVALLTCRGDTP